MLKKNKSAYLTVLVAVSFIIAILIPLPALMLDLLIVSIIGFSIILYMRATTIKDWEDLSTFPSILLLLGIFRVSLSIATTRKILVDGEPGQVIEEFGNFVIGGSILVGCVIFLVLIIFQFVVVNGSARTAEVAARFTLDGMQNKYMSIDTDVQRGAMSEDAAQEKRKKVAREADFYGSMDGVGKFLKGDVIFGIVLIFINITFGIIIGVTALDMSFQESAVRFTTLTIGDGIVTQIGSLMSAVASALILTRVFDDSDEALPNTIYRQIMSNEVVVYALGGLFVAMGLFTELPLLPFVFIGGTVLYLGFTYQRRVAKEKEDEAEKNKKELLLAENEQTEEMSEKFGINVNKHPILIEVGIDLVPLITQKKNGTTAKDRITMRRKSIAKDLGVFVPGIQFQDNATFKPKGRYEIKIMGTTVAEGIIKPNQMFAMRTTNVVKDLTKGEPGKDPIFGQDGYWITEDLVNEAKLANYQVLEPIGILISHIDMAIRSNLHNLIQRQQIKELIDELGDTHPVLIDEIKKKNIDLSLIQRVIKELLKESISLRELPLILEGVIDGAELYKNIDEIISVVREKIVLQLVEMARNKKGQIDGIILPEAIEGKSEVIEYGHKGYMLNWSGELETGFITELMQVVKDQMMYGVKPVILTRRKDFRSALSKVLQKHGINIMVLAIEEVSNIPNTQVSRIPFME